MTLATILLQIEGLVTDTVSSQKIQAATAHVKAHVDSLTNTLTNTDSLASLSPKKVVGALTSFDWSGVITNFSSQILSFALRLIAAILIFYAGRFIINKIHNLLRNIFIARGIDRSLGTFMLSFIKITLMFLLVIIVIGVIGIETSSFIAIFASAGVAIGLALSGTLQNFAGGMLILFIKPYRVGDFIEFENYKGTVKEILIFHTVITTINNERVVIPNGKLSTGTINNYSAEGYRRIEWHIGISYGDDVEAARKVIMDIFAADPDIITNDTATEQEEDPVVEAEVEKESKTKRRSWLGRLFHHSRAKAAEWKATKEEEILAKLPKIDYSPSVSVEELADSAVVLLLRAWVKNSNYWPVLYRINEQVYTQLPRNGLNFPFPQIDVHLNNSKQ